MLADAQTLVSPEIQAFANGFPVALMHAGVTLLILLISATAYAVLTPHKDVQLIRQGNTAAAVSFGGVLLSLALPLGRALSASASVIETAIWGVAVSAVLLLLFRLTDMLLKGLPERIKDGDVPAAGLLAAAKLAVAIVVGAAVSG